MVRRKARRQNDGCKKTIGRRLRGETGPDSAALRLRSRVRFVRSTSKRKTPVRWRHSSVISRVARKFARLSCCRGRRLRRPEKSMRPNGLSRAPPGRRLRRLSERPIPHDVSKMKNTHAIAWVFFILEAPPGIGPGIRVLQTRALPLGHGAVSVPAYYTAKRALCQELFGIFFKFFSPFCVIGCLLQDMTSRRKACISSIPQELHIISGSPLYIIKPQKMHAKA